MNLLASTAEETSDCSVSETEIQLSSLKMCTRCAYLGKIAYKKAYIMQSACCATGNPEMRIPAQKV